MKQVNVLMSLSFCLILVMIIMLSIWCTTLQTYTSDCIGREIHMEQQTCSSCIHNNKAEIKTSHIGDRGVFAKVDIKAGEVVEVCPLVIDKRSNVPIGTAIDDYVFSAGGDDVAFSFGYCSFYNHNTPNNVDWRVNTETKTMTLTANTDIRKGEEMFVSYGDTYWVSRGIVPKTYIHRG